MTPVRLIAVEGRRLILGPCDLLDGTPVFDLKPYVPAYDSFPGAKAGWIDDVDAALKQPGRYSVVLGEQAKQQRQWLQEKWSVEFIPRMTELLERDPAPHRTRRIKRRGSDRFEIGCGAWKAVFSVEALTVLVHALEPAYPPRFLHREGYDQVPDRDAQVAFYEQWPG